jgi:predicted AlkP superfamily phosphohydrolase/phosphomutase
MLSGRDPGELGLYGFRGRRSRDVRFGRLCDAGDLETPLLWDLLGEQGRESIVVGFPPSWPPRPLRGQLVSGMLTPDDAPEWTFPPELAGELERSLGQGRRYAFDADAHRAADPERLRDEVFAMTRARFDVVRHLLRTRSWDFGFVHEIGLDRLQHALWATLDEPGSEGEGVLRDYHRLLDAEIGETLEELPPDTVVCVVSDHGARRYEGSFCLNEWLRIEGYLALRSAPAPGDRPAAEQVDWPRTRAWADGGYCGRIYLNVAGRDPDGVLSSAEARRARDEIREKLEALRGPDDVHLASAVYLPEEVYARVTGIAPDLLFYPGDLRLRCAETLGHGGLFLEANDTGPDVANHAWEGLFVLADPEREGQGAVPDAHLLDVAPTLCERLDLVPPGWMRGGRLA